MTAVLLELDENIMCQATMVVEGWKLANSKRRGSKGRNALPRERELHPRRLLHRDRWWSSAVLLPRATLLPLKHGRRFREAQAGRDILHSRCLRLRRYA